MSAPYDISSLYQVSRHAHAANGFKRDDWFCATVIDKGPRTTCMKIHEMVSSPLSNPFPLKTLYEVCEPIEKRAEMVKVAMMINK